MAREQPNVGDLLPLLESSDIRQLEEIKGLINEHLSTGENSAFNSVFGLGQSSFYPVLCNRGLWQMLFCSHIVGLNVDVGTMFILPSVQSEGQCC